MAQNFLGGHFRGVTAEHHKKIQPKSVTLRTAQVPAQRCESTYNRNSAFAHRGGINRGGSRDVSSPLMFSNCADGMKQQPHSHTRFDLFAVLQEAIRENLCRRRRLWCPQALLWGYFSLVNSWPPRDLKATHLWLHRRSGQRPEVNRRMIVTWDGRSHPMSQRHAGGIQTHFHAMKTKIKHNAEMVLEGESLISADRCYVTWPWMAGSENLQVFVNFTWETVSTFSEQIIISLSF